MTQEYFSDISSRTYMSVLENGRKKPSVDKIDSLANAIGVHPLTILTLSYLIANEDLSLADLQKKVSDELSTLNTSEGINNFV